MHKLSLGMCCQIFNLQTPTVHTSQPDTHAVNVEKTSKKLRQQQTAQSSAARNFKGLKTCVIAWLPIACCWSAIPLIRSHHLQQRALQQDNPVSDTTVPHLSWPCSAMRCSCACFLTVQFSGHLHAGAHTTLQKLCHSPPRCRDESEQNLELLRPLHGSGSPFLLIGTHPLLQCHRAERAELVVKPLDLGGVCPLAGAAVAVSGV